MICRRAFLRFLVCFSLSVSLAFAQSSELRFCLRAEPKTFDPLKVDDDASLTDSYHPNFCPDVKTYCTVAPTADCHMLSGNNKLHTGSPIYQVTSSVAPVFLIDCVNDGGTPLNQKILLNARLNSLGATHDCAQVGPEHRANNCNHAFQYWCDSTVTCDTGAFKGNVNDLAINFLCQYLKDTCP